MPSSRRPLSHHLPALGAGAGALAVAILTVSSLGVAVAANGGSLVLGHKNTATSTTKLIDKSSTPLALDGPAAKPPLTVTSSKQVPRLNASLVGGLSSSQLQHTISGSCAAGISGVGSSGAVTCVNNTVVFSADATFTVPAGVTSLLVTMVGAGGGGGSQPGGNPQTAIGGGSGATAIELVPVTPGLKIAVDVGVGGTGGTTTGENGGGTDISLAAGGHGSGLGGVSGGKGGGPSGCDSPPTDNFGPGAGGVPDGFTHPGVIGISTQYGTDGSCSNGGGVFGVAGYGGAPLDDGAEGGDGADGVVVFQLS